MPIYVKSDVATKLLTDVMQLTGETNKTDALIDALRAKKQALQKKTLPSERIHALQAEIEALGPSDPDFDIRSFSDELSGQ